MRHTNYVIAKTDTNEHSYILPTEMGKNNEHNIQFSWLHLNVYTFQISLYFIMNCFYNFLCYIREVQRERESSLRGPVEKADLKIINYKRQKISIMLLGKKLRPLRRMKSSNFQEILRIMTFPCLRPIFQIFLVWLSKWNYLQLL